MGFLKSIWFKIIAVVLVIGLLFLESVINHHKDFDIFIGASKLIFNGKSCYEVWIKSDVHGLKYFYSPLFAVLLFPLKFLPQIGYNLIWISINFLIIYRIFNLLHFFLPTHKLSSSYKKDLFLLLTVLSVTRYILDNLALGQMTFLLVWGSLESMRLIFQNKQLAGTALLALMINFKIIPVALITYLIYKRNFKSAVLTGLFFVLYMYLPALVIGYNFNNQLLTEWLSSLSGTNSNSIFEDSGRPSLSSLLPSLLMNTDIQFSLKRNTINLNPQQVNLALNVTRAAFLLLLAYLFGNPFSKQRCKKNMFYDVSLICLATPLIFPHQGKYSIFYLLPAYAFCIYTAVKLYALKSKHDYYLLYKKILFLLSLSFILVTLTTDGLIGRSLSNFAESLHLITYGSLLLLIAMIYLKPKAPISAV
jgi:hypothetical protein